MTRSSRPAAPPAVDRREAHTFASLAMGFAISLASVVAFAGGCSTGEPKEDGLPGAYRNHCLACHGEAGDGRGPAAGSLRPAPPDFADAAWQASRSDEQLRAVIRDGGAAHGMSPHMPGHAHLSEADLDGLVAWIRTNARAASNPH